MILFIFAASDDGDDNYDDDDDDDDDIGVFVDIVTSKLVTL